MLDPISRQYQYCGCLTECPCWNDEMQRQTCTELLVFSVLSQNMGQNRNCWCKGFLVLKDHLCNPGERFQTGCSEFG